MFFLFYANLCVQLIQPLQMREQGTKKMLKPNTIWRYFSF